MWNRMSYQKLLSLWLSIWRVLFQIGLDGQKRNQRVFLVVSHVFGILSMKMSENNSKMLLSPAAIKKGLSTIENLSLI